MHSIGVIFWRRDGRAFYVYFAKRPSRSFARWGKWRSLERDVAPLISHSLARIGVRWSISLGKRRRRKFFYALIICGLKYILVMGVITGAILAGAHKSTKTRKRSHLINIKCM
jgi:hypothetical protein